MLVITETTRREEKSPSEFGFVQRILEMSGHDAKQMSQFISSNVPVSLTATALLSDVRSYDPALSMHDTSRLLVTVLTLRVDLIASERSVHVRERTEDTHPYMIRLL